ncbi:MAG: AAA family ATPase [Myxococcota bacterium]|nr:AAA family ATPase [Myxococcota bacterium]
MTVPAAALELSRLAEPAAHPLDASAAAGVEWVQTHLSHVFLTGERVYKFRKPVDLGFVCFVTREQRNADCLREVALNRRLAPDVYFGVAPLLMRNGRPEVGAPGEELAAVAGGEVPEHCVVMRRLPEGRDALSLLEAGRLDGELLDRLAVRLARFHGAHGLGVPAPFDTQGWWARCTRPLEESFAVVADAELAEAGALLEEGRRRAGAFALTHRDRFERRRLAGRAVDSHGDLHLQHVWFERDDAEPLVIDCLEFTDSLRHIDAAAEVAFTAMDLDYRGRLDLAERFLSTYAAEADDFDLYGVVDYFACYRAAVRAKVAALAAVDGAIGAGQRGRAAESAIRHLELAARVLAPRAPGALVLVGGVVGTGKSTAARAIRDRLHGVVVATDRVRKAGAEVASGPVGLDEGIYSEAARDRVYDAVLERARPVLASGRVAILDATWSRRAHRDRARGLAAELGSRALFVETRCADAVALDRLARRRAAGRDLSDAGPELHAESRARFEGRGEGEGGAWLELATDRPGWREALAVVDRELGA